MPIHQIPTDDGLTIRWQMGSVASQLLRADIPGDAGSKQAKDFVTDTVQASLNKRIKVSDMPGNEPDRQNVDTLDNDLKKVSDEVDGKWVTYRLAIVTRVDFAGDRYSVGLRAPRLT